ncbi:hypothetical protein [Arsenophonus apicola]|uniref:hypothetical protein n=1 Tax=Arsenophonus apicola TaxID=2879119 RepID=UPI003879B3C7
MKLLYKVSIVIILSICHFVPAIADKIQPPFPTRITDIPKHNKRHYHRYEDIKAMTQENLAQARIMLQENLNYTKVVATENLNFADSTIDKAFNFAYTAIHNNTVKNDLESLKSSLELSNTITNKALETVMTNIAKSSTIAQTGITKSFKATNVATRKSLDTYVSTTFHNGVNYMDQTGRRNTSIKPNSHNSGSSVHNSNSNIENHEEELANLNRDYP